MRSVFNAVEDFCICREFIGRVSYKVYYGLRNIYVAFYFIFIFIFISFTQ